MKKLLFALGVALWLCAPAHAQVVSAYTVSACGAQSNPAGQPFPLTMDLTGNLCGSISNTSAAPLYVTPGVNATSAATDVRRLGRHADRSRRLDDEPNLDDDGLYSGATLSRTTARLDRSRTHRSLCRRSAARSPDCGSIPTTPAPDGRVATVQVDLWSSSPTWTEWRSCCSGSRRLVRRRTWHRIPAPSRRRSGATVSRRNAPSTRATMPA